MNEHPLHPCTTLDLYILERAHPLENTVCDGTFADGKLYIKIASCIWAVLHWEQAGFFFLQHTHFVLLHDGMIDRRWWFLRHQIIVISDWIIPTVHHFKA
jgi:hypothetical protein